MDSQRHRYVFGLIGAPCYPIGASASKNATKEVVTRVSLDPDIRRKSAEERAASYLEGVGHDIDTMREFFGRGQDISELFSYNYVDAQGKRWLLKKLREAFARLDVRAFFVYYTGHGYEDDGAWHLGDGTIAPDELFQLWQGSRSGRSGDSVLIIISDSCFSGYWVEAAKQARLSSVAVQTATDHENPSYDRSVTGGVFTYSVYRRGSIVFQSIFSVAGFLSAVYHGAWLLCKEAVGLVLPSRDPLYPQAYVPDEFQQIMARRGGTIQPSKVINNGRFLFVDTFEWIMFRPLARPFDRFLS
jgi:hypothetical protein